MGEDEQLPRVQEHGVDLDDEGERAVRDVLVAGDGEAVAEGDAEVVQQQLVGAPLPMVDQHVHRVVQEVADGEAHEDVAGVRGLVDEIIMHLRGLTSQS